MAISLMSHQLPQGSPVAAPIAMSVAGRKYHYTLELSSHIAAAILPFGSSVFLARLPSRVMAHQSCMLTVLPISQGKYLIDLLFNCQIKPIKPFTNEQ